MKVERLSCALAAACGLAAAVPAGAQAVFRGTVPDFYQHQRWGDATDAGDPMQQASWEFGGGSFGGWCFHAGMTNALYSRYAKDKVGKYKDLLPEGIDGANWIANANNEVERFQNQYKTEKNVDTILRNRIGAPDHTKKNGLVYIEAMMGKDAAGADAVRYFSASGKQYNAPYKDAKLFNSAMTELDRGHEVNLIVRAKTTAGVTYSPKLWWAGDDAGNFHTLTMSGYDKTAVGGARVWFADPDANKGNNDADAIFDSGARKPNAAFKAKRYAAGDAFPTPAALDVGRQQYNWYNFDAADGRTMTSTSAVDNRYNNVKLFELDMVQTAQAYNKAPPGPGGLNEWAITAGDTTAVDAFWVFPSEDLDLSVTMPAFSVAGTPWSLTEVLAADAGDPEMDPWLNDREHGGFLMTAPSSGNWLLPSLSSFGDLTFLTTMAMSGMDIFFKNAGSDEWTFQVYGKEYEIKPDQVPAPGVLSVIGMGLIMTRRRRGG